MLGIILLAIFSMWIWIGRGRSLGFKIILSGLILLSYVVFLQKQGASNEEIMEILLSFDF